LLPRLLRLQQRLPSRGRGGSVGCFRTLKLAPLKLMAPQLGELPPGAVGIV